jgi:hypothetical protein
MRAFQGAFADSREDASTAFPRGSPAIPSAAETRQAALPAGMLFSTDLPYKMAQRFPSTTTFRNGDRIVNEVVARLAARGVRDLTIVPTALFPVHDALLPYYQRRVITKIEGLR